MSLSAARTKGLRLLASPRLLFYLLPWLMLLVVVGTLLQAQVGIYDAEQRIFGSWWVWAGPIPLPGLYAVLALMTLSLSAKLILKSVWKPRFIGTLLTHGGVLVLFIGGLLTALTQQEGYIPIAKGMEKSTITDYHERRLTITRDSELIWSARHHDLHDGMVIDLPALPFTVRIIDYHRHAYPYVRDASSRGLNAGSLNADNAGSRDSAIKSRNDEVLYKGLAQQVALKEGELMKDDEANHTGMTFEIQMKPSYWRSTPVSQEIEKDPGVTHQDDDINGTYILFEPMPRYPSFEADGERYELRLQKAERDLPFAIRLNDFQKITYPGTEEAREYQSDVTIIDGASEWRGIIAMNEPLRYGGYTFYQSSFFEGGEIPVSVLAAVKNEGLLFPYIASVMIGLGLLWHVLLMMRRR